MKTPMNEVTWLFLLHLTVVSGNSESSDGSITASIGVAITGLALAVICFCCLRRCFMQNKESPLPYRKMKEPKTTKKITATPTAPETIALTESTGTSLEHTSTDGATTKLPATYGTAAPAGVTTISLPGGSPPPPYKSLFP